MKSRKAVRRIAAALVLYVVASGALAILIAEATLHPARRVLSNDDIARGHDLARRRHAALSDPMIIALQMEQIFTAGCYVQSYPTATL